MGSMLLGHGFALPTGRCVRHGSEALLSDRLIAMNADTTPVGCMLGSGTRQSTALQLNGDQGVSVRSFLRRSNFELIHVRHPS
jgi:hypothetical protein